MNQTSTNLQASVDQVFSHLNTLPNYTGFTLKKITEELGIVLSEDEIVPFIRALAKTDKTPFSFHSYCGETLNPRYFECPAYIKHGDLGIIKGMKYGMYLDSRLAHTVNIDSSAKEMQIRHFDSEKSCVKRLVDYGSYRVLVPPKQNLISGEISPIPEHMRLPLLCLLDKSEKHLRSMSEKGEKQQNGGTSQNLHSIKCARFSMDADGWDIDFDVSRTIGMYSGTAEAPIPMLAEILDLLSGISPDIKSYFF